MTANHSSMTGPKSDPKRPGPQRWITNSPMRMTIVTGRTNESNAGTVTLRPSTADSTEIDGVMRPSP